MLIRGNSLHDTIDPPWLTPALTLLLEHAPLYGILHLETAGTDPLVTFGSWVQFKNSAYQKCIQQQWFTIISHHCASETWEAKKMGTQGNMQPVKSL